VNTYLTIKALHLIAVVAWFAGLFYLPRLFVYHLENPRAAAMFMLMERRLSLAIMTPAAIAAILCGIILLALNPAFLQQGWMHAKLGLVALLIAYHISLEAFRRRLAAGTCRQGARFFRFYNEVPTLFLILIVLLAVLQPF